MNIKEDVLNVGISFIGLAFLLWFFFFINFFASAGPNEYGMIPGLFLSVPHFLANWIFPFITFGLGLGGVVGIVLSFVPSSFLKPPVIYTLMIVCTILGTIGGYFVIGPAI